MRVVVQLWAFGLSLLFAASVTWAAPPVHPADEAFDRQLETELGALDATLVPTWKEANQARESGASERARDLYAEVARKAPTFVPALRRQGGMEARLGHKDEAVRLLRQAVEADPSAPNLSSLAQSLLVGHQPGEHGPDLDEALTLAKRAVAAGADDVWARLTLCNVLFTRFDVPDFDECVRVAQRVAPDYVETATFTTFHHIVHGEFDEAQVELEHARALGLAPAEVASMSRIIDNARPWTDTALHWAPRLIGLWLLAFGVLFALGVALSGVALRVASRPVTEAAGEVRGVDALVRRLYALVIGLSCLFYYISIPLVALTVLALGGGIIYAFFALGRIPIKLVAIVAIFVIVTLWAMAKSLFVRARDEDPGTRLDLAAHPKLGRLLAMVAARVGTRPVDSVYITPRTEIAVMERGGLIKQMTERSERCLVLGLGVLPGMEIGPLKAILAHEYGHFSNRDTAGGRFSLAVRRSLLHMAVSIAQGGAAGWYNPAWLFLRAFYAVFLRISQGSSRLQEVLADRWSALCYGAAAFERGLRHAIAQSTRFDERSEATLRKVVEEKLPLRNLYRPDVEVAFDESKVERTLAEAIDAPSSPYDSHPAPAERFRLVHAMPGAVVPPAPEDGDEAWTLFGDRDALERQMTDEIRIDIAARMGVHIPAELKVAV